MLHDRIVNVDADQIRKHFGIVDQDSIGVYLDHLASAEIPNAVEAEWEILDGEQADTDDQFLLRSNAGSTSCEDRPSTKAK